MGCIKHVLEAQQFDLETIHELFEIAQTMEESPDRSILAGKIMVNLFYEPSTRTRLSFESAMHRLGGTVVGTENAREFSSAAKGESLEDSIRVASGYGDVIVLRHNIAGSAERAARFSSVPVINAGDGPGQHPTQALLDLYTIKKIFGQIENLDIAMVGDLVNGRTVRSLCYFLAKHFSKNRIVFVSPSQTKMKDDIKEYLDKYNVKWTEISELDGVLGEIDVLYQTRIQKERFQDDPEVYEQVKSASEHLTITPETTKQMKESAIIMHPLPRVDEISHRVDLNSRAKYFEQAQNGLYIRMALLKMILAS